MVSPAYFAGAIQLGGLMQTATAFGSVQDALSFFVTIYRQLAEWRAVVERLAGFDAVDRRRAQRPRRRRPSSRLRRATQAPVELQGPVGAPAERHTVGHRQRRFNQAGERVLVSGPSGSGKSTLFRAIAGIWPFGDGTITVPKNARVMMLPQRPYFPIAPLAAAVAYPAEPGTFDAGESGAS